MNDYIASAVIAKPIFPPHSYALSVQVLSPSPSISSPGYDKFALWPFRLNYYFYPTRSSAAGES